jgi:Ketopantoate reductase PanE/ApbA.
MNVLIVGCGWVGTYVASRLLSKGYKLWGTCRTPEKAAKLKEMGLRSYVIDFDRDAAINDLPKTTFDTIIISVPITRKDAIETVSSRFKRLTLFLKELSFRQVLYFGSIGIYPKVDGLITEDTFAAEELDEKLWLGESRLRTVCPDINVFRLGGLFGQERIFAKYFAGKVCEIGFQTANFVHVEDVCRIISITMEREVRGATYNVVCPEHPLKKDVIAVSAAKYGYGLPSSFTDSDQTAKIVSSNLLVAELGYSFVYRSPLQF